MKLRALGWLFSAILSITACSGNDTAGLPGDGGITAQIDGQAWSSADSELARYTAADQFLFINGFGGMHNISFGVGFVTGPGTYSLTYLNTDGSSAILATLDAGWNTYLPGGTGEIIISELTDTRVAGTFSFEATPASGSAAGTARVTDGQFDLMLTQESP